MTVGIEVHIGPERGRASGRGRRLRRRAIQLDATSSPKAHTKRFSPLIRDAITSPGNQDRSSAGALLAGERDEVEARCPSGPSAR